MSQRDWVAHKRKFHVKHFAPDPAIPKAGVQLRPGPNPRLKEVAPMFHVKRKGVEPC